jgi:hypothetical protein
VSADSRGVPLAGCDDGFFRPGVLEGGAAVHQRCVRISRPAVMSGYCGTIMVRSEIADEELYAILPVMQLLRHAPRVNCIFRDFGGDQGWWLSTGIEKALFAAKDSLSAALLSDAICPVDRVMFRGAVQTAVENESPSLAVWYKKEYAPAWLTRDAKLGKWNWQEQHVTSTFPQASFNRAAQIRAWMKTAGMMELFYVDGRDVVLDMTQV